MGFAPIKSRQRGVIAIMFAVMLLAILGFMGLSLDLSRLYNRKVEMQAVADAAALAAARSLVGTAAGVDAAVAAASDAAESQKYLYNKESVNWSNAAIQFSSSAGSGWIDAAAARAAPHNIAFARVDTSQLDAAMGTVDTMFMRVLSPALASVTTSAQAIAGRSTINVTPLAVCAMSTVPAASRAPGAELVQYGFRRGVGYDLMQLNPGASTPENFVINPIDPPGAAGSASNTDPAVVGPFVCAGNMPMMGVSSGPLAVSRPFPLASLYQQLNSRFGQYVGGQCNFRDAPPDANVKSYVYNASSSWMKVAPAGQSAATLVEAARRHTVADPASHPGNTAPAYGPLWSFAKPVPFSAYTPGVPEPAAGYPTIAKAGWPALYAPGLPEPKSSYPSTTPYQSYNMANFTAPSPSHGKGIEFRRVLNVPLLECPVAGGAGTTGTVLAIGRFFMTVPATATTLNAEFAGIASEPALGGAVELYK